MYIYISFNNYLIDAIKITIGHGIVYYLDYDTSALSIDSTNAFIDY